MFFGKGYFLFCFQPCYDLLILFTFLRGGEEWTVTTANPFRIVFIGFHC